MRAVCARRVRDQHLRQCLTWWSGRGENISAAAPRRRGDVFVSKSDRLPLGHVAVISRIITSRVVMVTHANLVAALLNGKRGHTEQDVTLTGRIPGQ